MLDALQYDFMRNAVAAGVLAAVACGIIGVYVVVKRVVFISGLASALGMGLVTRRTRLPEDTAIGIMWAIGMAMGIIFIGLAPGYVPDLFSYLFGNILTVPFSDLVLMIALDAVIVVTVVLLYKEFLALSFDEEFGAVVGVPVERLYLLLLCLIALTVVVLIRVVGIILVIALLTIPAAVARQLTHDMKKMMVLATVLGALFAFFGLWLSYEFDVASGATIILLGGAAMLASFGFSGLRRVSGREAIVPADGGQRQDRR